ncbi:hypothetical protein ABH999_005522 [Bradyrhizobium yuanmingense]
MSNQQHRAEGNKDARQDGQQHEDKPPVPAEGSNDGLGLG